MNDVLDDREVATRAAQIGAEVIRGYLNKTFTTHLKGAVDPVTEVDQAAETEILTWIRTQRPDDIYLAEEGGIGGATDQKTHHPSISLSEAADTERVWLVDPLDGTVNFVSGIPQVSVSVALWEAGQPKIGVVLDVHRSEEIVAVSGQGATLDNEPITCQQPANLSEAVVATGFPYDRHERAAQYATTLGAVLERVRGIRRLGSAALDMAWVGAGRLGAYWEFGLSPWDMAAGMLIAAEAGAKVTDHQGRPALLQSTSLVIAPPQIHTDLMAAIHSVPLPIAADQTQEQC